jgi:Ca2+-transporting ATPase
VGLYGLALLLTVLATELGVLQRVLGTTSPSGEQWVAAAVALPVLVVDEVIKLTLRPRGGRAPRAGPVPASAATAPA